MRTRRRTSNSTFSRAIGPWAGVYKGLEALRRLREEVFEGFDEFRWEAEELIDAGDVIVIVARFYSRGRTSEIETVSRQAQVGWFDHGKMVRYVQCRSPAEALEAAGLGE